jgi:hypothetical protein
MFNLTRKADIKRGLLMILLSIAMLIALIPMVGNTSFAADPVASSFTITSPAAAIAYDPDGEAYESALRDQIKNISPAGIGITADDIVFEYYTNTQRTAPATLPLSAASSDTGKEYYVKAILPAGSSGGVDYNSFTAINATVKIKRAIPTFELADPLPEIILGSHVDLSSLYYHTGDSPVSINYVRISDWGGWTSTRPSDSVLFSTMVPGFSIGATANYVKPASGKDAISGSTLYAALNSAGKVRYPGVTFVSGDNGTLSGVTAYTNFNYFISGKTFVELGITVPTPVPDEGYEFDYWSSDIDSDTYTDEALRGSSFSALGQDETFTAHFKSLPSMYLSVESYVGNYDGSEHSITAGAYADDAFSGEPLEGVTYYYGLDGITWSEDLPEFTDVTDNPVPVYVKAIKDGYLDAYEEGSVEILPGYFEQQWPTAAGIVEGSLLSASILSGGSTDFGTFSWADGSVVPAVGSGSYKVIFTPSDNTLQNYSGYSLEGEVTLTVTAKPPVIVPDDDDDDDDDTGNTGDNDDDTGNNDDDTGNNDDDTGNTGSNGNTGNDVNTGSNGNTGNTGSNGNTGNTGINVNRSNFVTTFDGLGDFEISNPDTSTTSGSDSTATTDSPTSIGDKPTPLDTIPVDGNTDGGLSTSTIIILSILLLLLLAILATYFLVKRRNREKEA